MPQQKKTDFTSRIIDFAQKLTSTLRDKYPDMRIIDNKPHHVFLPDLKAIKAVKGESIIHWEKVFVSGRLASATVWRAGNSLVITDEFLRDKRDIALLDRLFGEIEDMYSCNVCMEDAESLNSCPQCQYSICNTCKVRCSKCPACRTPLPSGITCSYADLRLAFPYA